MPPRSLMVSIVADAPRCKEKWVPFWLSGQGRGAARSAAAAASISVPVQALRVQVGDGTARLSADYRLRIAGNAAPTSGAALTISAGF